MTSDTQLLAPLSRRAREVVTHAGELARQTGVPTITTPFLVISAWQRARETPMFLYERVGVDRNEFLGAVAALANATAHQRNQGSSASGQSIENASFGEDVRRVLIKAKRLSGSDGRPVEIEHIVWALGVEPGPIKDILSRQGISDHKWESAVTAYRAGRTVSFEPENGVSQESPHPALSRYAVELVEQARSGTIHPAIGRNSEVRRILQTLSRRTKNNPVLVGDPGTGKTAIIEGLAHRILRGDVPDEIRKLRIWALDMASLVAGAGVQGQFEERLKSIVEEAAQDPGCVLFIDEMHLLMGAGQTGGSMDAANILKPELARGRIKVVGATTAEEWRKWIEKDKAFERRFQKIAVEEPDEEAALAILRGVKNLYESHHRVKILDEAVVAAVRQSRRYIPDRRLPDKAIDLLDEAASRMRMERSSIPAELDDLARSIQQKETERQGLLQERMHEDRIEELSHEIEALQRQENILNAKWTNERTILEELQRLRDEEERTVARRDGFQRSGRYAEAAAAERNLSRIRENIDRVSREAEGFSGSLKPALDENDVLAVLSDWTGIPVARMGVDETRRLQDMERVLSMSVVGQNEAVRSVSSVIRRNRMGFGDPRRPVGSFLFLGPTGVGKTELCKALAGFLFHDQDCIVRLDMSEYQQEWAVSRLFGAPPGYVGYGEGGQLTEPVRRRPFSVVLFDEIEKAHPKVFETLLQVLDDGRMTDGEGRTVDFRHTIIVLTSNVGQRPLAELSAFGSCDTAAATEAALSELKGRVAPEFLNRIDRTIAFLPLSQAALAQVAELHLKMAVRRMSENGVTLECDASVPGFLVNVSRDPALGARPVKRAIETHIVDSVCDQLLSGRLVKGIPVRVSVSDGNLTFTQSSSSRASRERA